VEDQGKRGERSCCKPTSAHSEREFQAQKLIVDEDERGGNASVEAVAAALRGISNNSIHYSWRGGLAAKLISSSELGKKYCTLYIASPEREKHTQLPMADRLNNSSVHQNYSRAPPTTLCQLSNKLSSQN
jgi:hypothetical protein